MTDADELAARFDAQRPRLRAIATRLLRSDAEADDAVQETWLRLARVASSEIVNLDAWLTTVVSRISLDVLRAPRTTRERAWDVSPWRDEPVAAEADPADVAAQHERVSVALLVVLEQLSPAERVAFVLHDVFGQPFEEIAVVLERSPDAARQLASRARRRVRGASEPEALGRTRSRAVIDAWLAAATRGDFAALLGLLDEGAVLHADFGSSTQVIEGPDEIAAQAVMSARLAAHSVGVLIDGQPGVAAVLSGRVVSIMAFEIAAGRILRLDVLADPARLTGLDVLPTA
ncbi:sigma-70 family RNA polymerase sigma factor [Microbacterium pygmaeum]|uniref:RNA polymerase sigma-70 factor, ECF subfamily n=1 Tax=Microbacterium pygmaeum TaxID=370764 RepID=A0A1G7WFG9_9MICO|nr:sigma-70 family RNA polymerase sigma factor [Microbacterium pygmaeum]SDG70723.1 RNA polymerase sigma-70 factor, ECF subfamily [Microbacterium pygmaeum]